MTALDTQTISPVNVAERKGLDIRSGDVVRVHQKIQEKGKTRLQVFEGLVLARKHGTEPGATFTVRATLSGIGVEKIFPLYSPMIEKIEVIRRSKVRRAKLYYIRDKVAREVRRQLRRMTIMTPATITAPQTDDVVSEIEEVVEVVEADVAPIEVAEPSTPEEVAEAEKAA
ncbi:50S ribosomal protein L19 [Patescibacteria group bacterium]|nr:MAG: 50S ribosomal protein L19 [Patescibacteria group bacterium]